ncbi:MAG: formyltransferase family protein [Brevinematales bacterium]
MIDRNTKVAFYAMTSKGYFVIEKFIQEFGSDSIEYIVSSSDEKIQLDFYNDIKKLADLHQIKFFDRKDDYRNIENEFKGYKFAIAWKWLIKDYNNLIVLHDSLLPKYRGFAPLVQMLLNGEKRIGVTAIMATERYDEGDILLQKQIKITYPICIMDAIRCIEPLYYDIVKELYKKILKGKKLKGKRQNSQKATFSMWLDEKDYFIDFSWSADKIERFVKAVGFPYDCAKAYVNGSIVKIVDVEKADIDVCVVNRQRHYGKVIFKEKYPVVVCGKGLLIIKEIRDRKGNNIIDQINFRTRFE